MASKTVDIVDFTEHLAQDYGRLLETKANSDVVFVVSDTRFSAHRLILAAHSKFFQVLLFENRFKEGNQNEIPLEVPLKAFGLLLTGLYTGKVDLSAESLETGMELYELAHRYGISPLEEKLGDQLVSKLTVKDFFILWNFISLFDLAELETKCFEFIDKNVQELFSQEIFLTVDKEILKKILARETLKTTTIQKFEALNKWIKASKIAQTVVQKELLNLIDVSKLTNDQILKIVAPTNLYDTNVLLSITASRASDVPEEKSSVYFEANSQYLLHSANNELRRGSWADGATKPSTVFSMESTRIINFIEIMLGPAQGYEFSVEISTDCLAWEEIYKKEYPRINKVHCNVAPRRVKYFRFSGEFEILSFKTGYKVGLEFIDEVFVPSTELKCPKFLLCDAGYGPCSETSDISLTASAIEKKVYLTQPLRLQYLRFTSTYGYKQSLTVQVIGKQNQLVYQKHFNVKTSYHYFPFPPNVVTAFAFRLNEPYSGAVFKDFVVGN